MAVKTVVVLIQIWTQFFRTAIFFSLNSIFIDTYIY